MQDDGYAVGDIRLLLPRTPLPDGWGFADGIGNAKDKGGTGEDFQGQCRTGRTVLYIEKLTR